MPQKYAIPAFLIFLHNFGRNCNLSFTKAVRRIEKNQKFVAAKPPRLFLFGDYIENGPEDIQSTVFWQMVLNQCREFAAQYVKDGGDATVIYLPDENSHGNSHFMFQEKNNAELADLVEKCLKEHQL
ncbi:MAG: hypothetical protein IJ764_05160 [Bacteroidales bacterium]|nr:hypothetical protein [Bacteroidales bacterium]